MSPEDMFKVLREADVLTTTDGQITTHQRYEDKCIEYEERIETSEDVETVVSVARGRLAAVPTETAHGVDLLARYAALEDLTPEFSIEERLRVIIALFQFEDPDLPSDGAPRDFLSIDGSYLTTILALLGQAVVYIWLEDCDPCDVMQEDLEDVFSDGYDDVLPIAVYGPDSARTLHQEYDVAGGPVTLFVHDGSVDARLQGAHYPEIIESELDSLRTLADGVSAD